MIMLPIQQHITELELGAEYRSHVSIVETITKMCDMNGH